MCSKHSGQFHSMLLGCIQNLVKTVKSGNIVITTTTVYKTLQMSIFLEGKQRHGLTNQSVKIENTSRGAKKILQLNKRLKFLLKCL